MGEVTGESHQAALSRARQAFGNDGERYVEVTLHPQERSPTTRPAGFIISQEEAEAALLAWARATRGLPAGFQAKATIITRVTPPTLLVEFYDTLEAPVPGIDFDEEDTGEQGQGEVVPAEMREVEEMIPVELVVRSRRKTRKH